LSATIKYAYAAEPNLALLLKQDDLKKKDLRMDKLSQKCKELLKNNDIDLKSEIDFDINGDLYSLSFEYIIDSYMTASEDSKRSFLTALQEALKAGRNGAQKFFEGMGQLLLMTHLSKNIEIV
jgi:hypothetical protein